VIQKRKTAGEFLVRGSRRYMQSVYIYFQATPHQSVTPPLENCLQLANVQAAINDRWDWANFRAQFLFHAPQPLSIIVGDQVHRKTQVSETPRTTNTM